MTQSNHTLITLAKDAVFIAVGCFLILRTGFLGKVVGALAIIWYGRDFWVRGKAWLGTKELRRDTVDKPRETASRDNDAPIIDDGKIRVTDLSGAKEVDFEKE
ncbi:MAG: hypothetical protein IJ156_09640 [Bacteroidales bacterium]|nr:hypothetical protein [Bacteroidales bacterium]